MLRIFGHFLPIPPLILAIVEGAVLCIAINLIVRSSGDVHSGFETTSMQFSATVSLVVITSMVAVGLYRTDVFFDYRVAVAHLLVALILATPLTLGVGFLFRMRSEALREIGPYLPAQVAVVWLACV